MNVWSSLVFDVLLDDAQERAAAGDGLAAQAARRERALATPIVFRPGAAQPFDDRCLSWRMDARTVSIWTIAGRMRSVAPSASADRLQTPAAYRKGESDLAYCDGRWFLIATCDLPDVPVRTPDGFSGWIRGLGGQRAVGSAEYQQ